jgi:hypothetical protein
MRQEVHNYELYKSFNSTQAIVRIASDGAEILLLQEGGLLPADATSVF